MTNNEIIKDYVLMEGITEPLHTFARWKQMGYSVKKGEKSKHKIDLWKHKTVKAKTEDGAEVENNRMFKTTASMFLMSQVEKVEV